MWKPATTNLKRINVTETNRFNIASTTFLLKVISALEERIPVYELFALNLVARKSSGVLKCNRTVVN